MSSPLSLVPPFTFETATKKSCGWVVAQALWNTKSPEKVSKAYTEDSIWRNRDSFFQGHAAIRDFLEKKWTRETRYKLRKELFAFWEDRIAVQFWYEYYNEGTSGWQRVYGLEDWTFAADGRMRKRQMSANEVSISNEDRWFREDLSEAEVDAVVISEVHW